MLLHLAIEQQRQGLSPVIASIGEPGIKEKPIENEARKVGLKVTVFRMRPGPNWHGAKKMLDYSLKGRFDIIHSHGYKGNILFGFMPAKVRKKPLVSTLHGWTSIGGNPFSKMRLYEWMDSQSLRFIDKVVLVNAGMLKNETLAKLKSTGKVTVIDNGIPAIAGDTMNSTTIDSDIVSFCQKACVIGAIGRYSHEKGFDTLILAFRKLKGRCPKAKLLLIGDGSLRHEYKKLAEKHKIDGAIMFTGYRQNAWQYMTLINVLCMPSRTEGLPITLLEGMRAKVPIVATTVGGIPNVIAHKKTGILVAPDDVDALAQAISNLQELNGDAMKYAQNAYLKFLASYSSTTMANKYLQVYRSLDRLSI